MHFGSCRNDKFYHFSGALTATEYSPLSRKNELHPQTLFCLNFGKLLEMLVLFFLPLCMLLIRITDEVPFSTVLDSHEKQMLFRYTRNMFMQLTDRQKTGHVFLLQVQLLPFVGSYIFV